ncbi:MAG: methyltransferase domain-containing protein [Candidatus Yonathbacteria bacterium]|nr:methyltransferase domain-containing protein [Candidatus Yonathbacteria bacterium]
MDFSDPKKNVEQLHLREGMSVADFGAGSGAYSIAAAQAVGDSGKVYAVEVQKDLLQKLKNEATSGGVHNIEVLWGDIEVPHGTKIKDYAVDAVIISNVLFQAEDKRGVLNEARRILCPGGSMLVVDWVDSFGGLGPHPNEVLTQTAAKKLCNEAGFSYERDIGAGSHHYGMIFKKS